ncbi:MAG: cob(I)yrinic acid a,c-diamide adenosyltransferase [Verrucomicrobiae bacterium]
MRIYTGTGDGGETSLFSGQRVSKADPRVVAYGTLDEMNSVLGAALAAAPSAEVQEALVALQFLVFDLCTDLATAPKPGQCPRITDESIARIERQMDLLTEKLPPLRAFVLPGGSPAAAQIHIARTIARRAEREAVSAAAVEPISRQPLVFLNRLSDFLYLLARRENQLSGTLETEWIPSQNKTAAGSQAAGGC